MKPWHSSVSYEQYPFIFGKGDLDGVGGGIIYSCVHKEGQRRLTFFTGPDAANLVVCFGFVSFCCLFFARPFRAIGSNPYSRGGRGYYVLLAL